MNFRAFYATCRLVGTGLLAFCIVACDQKSPEKVPAGFFLPEGFELEVVAAAPLVHNPVAITFDEWGRMWVVEMTGYMRDADGKGEEAPTGQIRLLTDKDSDGRMDHMEVFLDHLVLPRAVARVYGGILFAEPPNLWFVPEINGKAGDRQLVDSTYAVGGNVEHQPNGLLLSLDNWIYSAKSDLRYRRTGGEWHREKTAFRGQWGITQDDFGHLFYNHNSHPLLGDLILPGMWEANPYHTPQTGANRPVARDLGLRVPQPTGVNRGYVEGVLDDQGRLCAFTSACGPVVYRGDQFPATCKGHAFVCAPEANLIREEVFSGKELDRYSLPADPNQEFITSSDPLFRPVNLNNGPDGTLYLVDFHRGIIQHRTYLTGYLRSFIEKMGLEQVKDQGRIYRLVHNGKAPRRAVVLGNYPSEALVRLLAHPNSWHRETAQRLLIERKAWSVAGALEALAVNPDHPVAQVHALWTLEGLHALTPECLAQAISSPNEEVQLNALKLAATAVKLPANACLPLLNSASESVKLMAFAVLCRQAIPLSGAVGQKMEDLVQTNQDNPWWVDAAMGAPHPVVAAGYATAFPGSGLARAYADFQNKKAGAAIRTQPVAVTAPFRMSPGEQQQGRNLYMQHCAACHGNEGTGNATLAPPLRGSEWVTGHPERLAALVLQGFEGPIQVAGKRYDLPGMAGLRSNPFLSASELTLLLRFLRQNWDHGASDITTEQVLKVKSQIADREQPFTESELKRLFP